PVLTIPFGIASKVASATNSVGLCPGSLASAFGFRNLFKETAQQLKLLLLPTLLGSILGCALLISTEQKVFDEIIPILILLATVIFFTKGLVLPLTAVALIIGALIGVYIAARVSQRFDPDKLRWAIVAYGVVMTGVFIKQAFFH